MARGRMLNKKVSASLQFDELPDDTCRLLATWTIAHLDVNGVFYADPAVVRSLVFTRRYDVTVEQIETYLQAMEGVGLIVRYHADGQMWQYWPEFRANQPGMRADRETAEFPLPDMDIPAPIPQDADDVPPDCPPDADELPQDGGEMSAEDKLSEVKLSKDKLSEDNMGADAPSSPPEEEPPKEPLPEKPPTPAQAMFTALAAVCRINMKLLSGTQRKQLNQTGKKLRDEEIGSGDVHVFGEWWFDHDWRGQKNQSPEPHQVREKWGEFTAWKESGRPPPTDNKPSRERSNIDSSMEAANQVIREYREANSGEP